MNRKILYIGNDLTARSKYNSMMETLSLLLKETGYLVIRSSSKKNKLFRILDMITTTIKHRKADYILIDTFSTLNFYYALIISQVARLLKTKYIPILHGGNLPDRLRDNNFFSKLIFSNSYTNVAPSQYLQSVFEKYNYPVLFIPNIIHIKDYTYMKRKTIRPRILWVRAFHKIYNPLMAVKVITILKRDYPGVELCMIGPKKDETYEQVLKAITNYNLEKNITITGVLPKEEWHKRSEEYDIFINTTTIDNTPVSIIEAMALGIPIVSTNVGGLPFLVKHNEEGILVEKNDPQMMAEKIMSLLVKGTAIEMTQKARKRAENFDAAVAMDKWTKILV